MLGIEVSQATVAKYMIRYRKPPSQTWRTCLDNHVTELVSVDFFSVPSATFRILYVCVMLRHDRREVVHFNVTQNPTAQWTAQQIVEAFPFDTAPQYLLRDRDRIYGGQFSRRVKSLGLAWIIHEATRFYRAPFSCSKSCLVGNTVCIPPGHVGSFTEFATEKGGGERIRRFTNSPG